MSGGTDFAGAFIGGNRELPLVAGRDAVPLLGCAVEAWSEQGEPVDRRGGRAGLHEADAVDAAVLLGRRQATQRYRASYFDMYPERLAPRRLDARSRRDGGCIIYGRSDATINRHGLRMGTTELYRAVEALPEVLDSLVVDLEYLGRESYMPLFVVLRAGRRSTRRCAAKINGAIKTALSPRFVPNEIFQVAEIPRTLSGKKQELPIKKLLLGQPLEKVVNKDAMANPGCLDWYVDLARRRAAAGAAG